jgi:uncharacterized protein with HEPN domain
MRNAIVHAYFSVDLDAVCNTATTLLGPLRVQLVRIRDIEFPGN